MKKIKQILFAGIMLSGLLFACSSNKTENPLLPGFYPDPSICRVGDDYYLVNSTFSYYPGVPIFHSRDLIHWKQIGHVLNRPSQLNLDSLRISEGIFAPAISYHDSTFYMITTLIGRGYNFFVTAKDPAGPWSDPVWLPEVDGIDPSFFFDENGKAYIVHNGPAPDNKPIYEGHRAIWLVEFDLNAQKVSGQTKVVINGGTDLAKKPIWIEGPHIYKKNGFYYLMAAEGGTAEDHSEVVFRSKDIWGPYESFENNPILTQRDLPADRKNPVTCTGHADLVETQDGDWVAVFLGCMPYEGNFYNTGRQTFILPVNWKGEWPVILSKGMSVPFEVSLPLKAEENQKTFAEASANWQDDFENEKLKPEWNFIRTPRENWYKLSNDSLYILARNVKLQEKGNPSFIGRRQQHAYSEIAASFSQKIENNTEVGLVAFQNERYFYKFMVLKQNDTMFLTLTNASEELIKTPIEQFDETNPIYLKIEARGKDYQCFFGQKKDQWKEFGGKLDGTILSTSKAGGFVGTYFGLYAYSPDTTWVSSDWVSYRKLPQP